MHARRTRAVSRVRSTLIRLTPHNPLCFGVGNDYYRFGTLHVAAPEIIRHKGRWYIAARNPALDGIRLARLRW